MPIVRRILAAAIASGLLTALLVAVGALTPTTALAAGLWSGQVTAGGPANVRSGPSIGAQIVGTLDGGSTVQVVRWVAGDTLIGVNDVWGELGPGRYVYSAELIKPSPSAPPPPPTAPTAGCWIDVNLTQQIATAYEGTHPVRWAVVSTGGPGWETPVGTFRILRRVANETMNSAPLGIPPNAPGGYDLPNVLYTQYFTDYGHALHDNYWKWDSPFGVPTSHGCVGMELSDAAYFWSFAGVGTPVVVHY